MARKAKTDDDVGYCKPPRSTQFKKGQSGNPKGRRPKDKSLRGTLERYLSKSIATTVRGEHRQMPLMDAFIQKLLADATNGDNRARALVLRFVQAKEALEKRGPADTHPSPIATLDETDRAILDRHKQEVRAQILREIADGELLLPEPDVTKPDNEPE